jgi:hypothetical protein
MVPEMRKGKEIGGGAWCEVRGAWCVVLGERGENSGGTEVVADGKKTAEDASLHHRKEVGWPRRHGREGECDPFERFVGYGRTDIRQPTRTWTSILLPGSTGSVEFGLWGLPLTVTFVSRFPRPARR